MALWKGMEGRKVSLASMVYAPPSGSIVCSAKDVSTSTCRAEAFPRGGGAHKRREAAASDLEGTLWRL